MHKDYLDFTYHKVGQGESLTNSELGELITQLSLSEEIVTFTKSQVIGSSTYETDLMLLRYFMRRVLKIKNSIKKCIPIDLRYYHMFFLPSLQN